jgi:DNA modification methylase
MGSGSTLIAAEETGRTCVGTELDPHYVDVTVRRWQALTGNDAIHLQTGQRFDDMAQNLLTHQEG